MNTIILAHHHVHQISTGLQSMSVTPLLPPLTLRQVVLRRASHQRDRLLACSAIRGSYVHRQDPVPLFTALSAYGNPAMLAGALPVSIPAVL